MDIALGMHVYTRDDNDIGTVDRLILNPERGKVQAVVVRQGTLLHHDVEVPVEMLTLPDVGGGARMAYSSNEVDRLPQFHEASYVTPPVDYVPPMGYPPTATYWPVGYGIGVPSFGAPAAAPVAPSWTGDADLDREVEAAVRREDLENAVIGEGSDVLGRDGEKVGTVRELTFDTTNSKLTGLVVHKGLIMGKDMELPASLIDSVDDGVVFLKVDAIQAVK